MRLVHSEPESVEAGDEKRGTSPVEQLRRLSRASASDIGPNEWTDTMRVGL